jgi:hypothetical protein
MDEFFYNVMRGDESFFGVYQQILFFGLTQGVSFTKEDVENMPPFERTGYIEMIKQHFKDMEEERKAEDARRKANQYK